MLQSQAQLLGNPAESWLPLTKKLAATPFSQKLAAIDCVVMAASDPAVGRGPRDFRWSWTLSLVPQIVLAHAGNADAVITPVLNLLDNDNVNESESVLNLMIWKVVDILTPCNEDQVIAAVSARGLGLGDGSDSDFVRRRRRLNNAVLEILKHFSKSKVSYV